MQLSIVFVWFAVDVQLEGVLGGQYKPFFVRKGVHPNQSKLSYGMDQSKLVSGTDQSKIRSKTDQKGSSPNSSTKIIVMDVCELDALSRKRVLSFLDVADCEYFGWMLVSKQW